MQFTKLHGCCCSIKICIQWNTAQKGQYGYQQGQDARIFFASCEYNESTDYRRPDQRTQYG